jgi:hypothetical protein
MNTDFNERILAQEAMRTPEQRMTMLELLERQKHGTTAERRTAMTEQARLEEKQRYGPHPSGNRHERRKAAKLMRGK